MASTRALTVALRGLRSRAVLTVGMVLLATIGTAAAVVGPAYLQAATNSLLVDRLDAIPTSEAGLSWDYRPAAGGQPVATVIERAKAAASSRAPVEFGPPEASPVSRRVAVEMPRYELAPELSMRSLEDGCQRLLVSGRCPTRPFEVLVARVDLERARGSLDVGDRIALPGLGEQPAVVVGAYRIDADAEWFDRSRFDSVPMVRSTSPGEPGRPYQPAPLITPVGTFDDLAPGKWRVEVDRSFAIDASLRPERADRLAAVADAEGERSGRRVDGGSLGPAKGNGLREAVDIVGAERATARDTVLPAVLSLSLVALLLLFRLFGEIADLRRPEFALLTLRGWSRRRLWAFGLSEAVVILVVAVPLGLVLGWQTTRLLASTWLRPGLSAELTTGSLVGAGGVLMVGVGAASIALTHVMREPLQDQLESTSRPRPLSRVELVIQGAVVLAAIVGGYAIASRDGRSEPGLTDLLLPLVLAMAIGLLAGHLTVLLARRLTRRTAGRPALTPYLSVRRLARRREGTLVVLPLAVALGVGVFATGVDLAAAGWRDSVAASRVGADLAYPSDLSTERTLGVTHEVDPEGEWLMAGTVVRNVEPPQIVALDTSRMAAVAKWPSDWGAGSDASAVGELLEPLRPAPRFEGRRMTFDLDNAIASDGALRLSVGLRDARGVMRAVTGAELPDGAGTVTVAPVPCARGCELVGLTIGGVASTPKPMHGEVVVRSLSVDGRPIDAGFDDVEAWRPVRPYTKDDGDSVVEVGSDSAGLRLEVDTGEGFDVAQLTPTDVPDVRPIVATDDVRLPAAPDLDDAGLLLSPGETDWRDADLPVRFAARSEAIPLLGRSGVLVDLAAYTREDFSDGGPGATVSYVFAREGMPKPMLDKLAAAGIDVDQPLSLGAEQAALGNDAYALSMRLYLVVAAALLLLALAGVIAHLVVGMPGRRRDAASLRVVGVPKRTVLRAGLVDLAITLGAAAVAGVVAGVVAQRLILGQIRLGTADRRSPDISADIDLVTLGGYVAATTVVLLVVSTLVATASVRGASGAELREAAR